MTTSMERASHSFSIRADPAAHALRPFKMDILGNRYIYFEGTTFPKGPWNGCDMYLRRLQAFGMIVKDGTETCIGLDVLDEDGSLLDTYTITQSGLNYLRRQLKFKKEVTTP